MALIICGKSRCSICSCVLDQGEDVMGLPPFIADRDHPFWSISDSGMHRTCFVGWASRGELVRTYNETAGVLVWGNGRRHRTTEDGCIDSTVLDDLAIVSAAARRAGQDRAGGMVLHEGYLLAVADGAGGISGGTIAAERVVDGVWKSRPSSVRECVDLLGRLDRELEGVGETTAVVVVATRNQVFGASVGDSEAWMISNGVVVLTQGQRRKPLLGSGVAVPVGFGPTVRKGRLVIGTDGLFKYVSSERIQELASSGNPQGVAEALVDAARLPSKALQDDAAVVVVT